MNLFLCLIGMVKTFQLAHKGQYGASIKLAPITTETIDNKETCLQVNGTSDFKIQPQTITPDTSEMEVNEIADVNSVILSIIYICMYKCTYNLMK